MLARILDLSGRGAGAKPGSGAARGDHRSGARLDPSLAQRFMDAYGEILYNGYGSSEVCHGVACDARRSTGDTGNGWQAGCRLSRSKFSTRTTSPVGPHVTGRVFVGGGLRFDGYTGRRWQGCGRQEMTDTGDMGYFERGGAAVHRRPRRRHDRLRRRERLPQRG